MDKNKINSWQVSLSVVLITIIISFALGALFKDYVIGPLTLVFGFLNAYYLALGRWENYIYGILSTLTYTYISAVNGLYGWLIFSLIFYIPSQIYGIVNWVKNKSKTEVKMRSFNLVNSIVICLTIIIGSVVLGFLLSLIPDQNLAFLDSTSQIINICGIILVVLRFRDCWYIWIVNNIIDLIIWLINCINGTKYSEMGLIVAIMFLVMNIIGLIVWIKTEKRQKSQAVN